MDKELIKSLTQHPGWGQVENYITVTCEHIKCRLVSIDPTDTSNIAYQQGKYKALIALINNINNLKED